MPLLQSLQLMIIRSSIFKTLLQKAQVTWKSSTTTKSFSYPSQLSNSKQQLQNLWSNTSNTFVKVCGLLHLHKFVVFYCTTKTCQPVQQKKRLSESADYTAIASTIDYVDKTEDLQIPFKYDASNIRFMRRLGKSWGMYMCANFYKIDHDNGERLYHSSKDLNIDEQQLKLKIKSLNQLKNQEQEEDFKKKEQEEDYKKKEQEENQKQKQIRKNLQNYDNQLKIIEDQIQKLKKKDPQSELDKFKIFKNEGLRDVIISNSKMEMKKLKQMIEKKKMRLKQSQLSKEKLKLQSRLTQEKLKLQALIMNKKKGLLQKKLHKNQFNDKKISKHPQFEERCQNQMGEHPIIFFQINVSKKISNFFKNNNIAEPFSAQDYQQELAIAIKDIKTAISTSFSQHKYLINKIPKKLKEKKNQWEPELKKFKRICKYTQQSRLKGQTIFQTSEIPTALLTLSKLLTLYWGAKPVILVDQFDYIWINYANSPCKDKLFPLLESLYKPIIKSQPQSRHKIILFGVLPFKYLDLLSGVNNMVNFGHLSKTNKVYFGFTKQQVKNKLKKVAFNNQDSKQLNQQLKYLVQYCNGYKMSGFEMFNPWLVNRCIQDIQAIRTNPQINDKIVTSFSSAWLDTGHMPSIRDIILNATKQEAQSIFEFMKRGFVYQDKVGWIRENFSIQIKEGITCQHFFYFLYYAGYLTASQLSNIFVPPNQSIKKYFYEQVLMKWINQRFPQYEKFRLTAINYFDQPKEFQKKIELMFNQSFLRMKNNNGKVIEYRVIEAELQTMITLLFQKQPIEEQKYKMIRQYPVKGGFVDRLLIPAKQDNKTVIIHEDKVLTLSSKSFESSDISQSMKKKTCQATVQILQKYLLDVIQYVLKSYQQDQIKYVVIQTNVLAFLQPEKCVTTTKQQFVKASINATTFSIQNAEKLSKQFKDIFDKIPLNQQKQYCNIKSGGNQMKEIEDLFQRYKEKNLYD